MTCVLEISAQPTTLQQ